MAFLQPCKSLPRPQACSSLLTAPTAIEIVAGPAGSEVGVAPSGNSVSVNTGSLGVPCAVTLTTNAATRASTCDASMAR